MRQSLARTLTIIVLAAAAACGPRPTEAPTATVESVVATLTPAAATEAAPATSEPTTAPSEAPPVATLPPTATSAPTEAALVSAPDDPCTDTALALAPELTLSYTGPRSDGLGNSIYLARADGTQPAEFVQGAFEQGLSWSANGQRLAFFTATGDAARPYTLNIMQDSGKSASMPALEAVISPTLGSHWSPDGRYVALIGPAGIYVVDALNGQATNVAADLPNATGAVWSPDGSRLAFQAPTNVALNNEYHVFTTRPDGTDRIEVVAETINDFVQDWLPDGTQLLVQAGAVGAPQQTYVVSLDGTTREPLFGGQSYGDSITYSPNNKKLAYIASELHLDDAGNITGSTEWLTLADADGANPHTVQALELGFGEAGFGAPQWSPNGRYLAFARSTVSATVTTVELAVADICTDAQTLVASGAVGAFSWKAGAPLATVSLVVLTPPETAPTPPPLGDSASQLAWTPDGQTLAAVTTAGVRFYDPATGAERTQLPAAGVCCRLSAFDGQYLANLAPDGTSLTVYDWQTQQVIFSLTEQPAEQLQSVAFSPDGTRMAVGERFQMRMYELPSGNLLETFQTAEVADSYVVALGFTADGNTLVSITQWEGIVQLWDVDALTLRRTMRIPTVTYFTLLPGARQLAADYAKPGFDLWEPATGFLLGKHPDIIGGGGPQFTVFSTDNRRVVVWGYASDLGRTLAIWDVPNNRQLQALGATTATGADNDWSGAAFSPDGTRLALSDLLGNIYIYDTVSWTESSRWAVPNSLAQP